MFSRLSNLKKKAKHQQTNSFYKKETFQEADEFWQDDKDE